MYIISFECKSTLSRWVSKWMQFAWTGPRGYISRAHAIDIKSSVQITGRCYICVSFCLFLGYKQNTQTAFNSSSSRTLWFNVNICSRPPKMQKKCSFFSRCHRKYGCQCMITLSIWMNTLSTLCYHFSIKRMIYDIFLVHCLRNGMRFRHGFSIIFFSY